MWQTPIIYDPIKVSKYSAVGARSQRKTKPQLKPGSEVEVEVHPFVRKQSSYKFPSADGPSDTILHAHSHTHTQDKVCPFSMLHDRGAV